MLIVCTYCSKKLNKKPSQIKRSKNHFCDKKCHNKWMRGKTRPEKQNKVKHNCHQCDKPMEVENYKYKRFLNGEIKNLFCNKNCLADWQRVNFKGEKSSKFNRITKKCGFCDEEYSIPKSRENTSKYCSNECHSNSRIEDIVVECNYCDSMFTKKRAQIKDRNFCSKSCSSKWNSENNNLQVAKECFACNKKYKVHRSRAESSKTCSRECHGIWLKEYYFKTEKGKQHLINNGVKSQLTQKHSDTKPERIIKELLIHKNIEFIPQHLMYDKFVVDFYLPKENIVIEVFGDYWHGNPLFYGELGTMKPLTEKQIKQKNKDKAREAYLKKCGHAFYILWEHDIYNNLEEVIEFL